jgi:hypothetical protein
MANVNSYNGFYNLPVQSYNASSAEKALLVPSAGSYPGLPSPQFLAKSGLSIPAVYDLATGGDVDGHAFKVKLIFDFVSASTETIAVKLYQVPSAVVGTIGSAGSVTSAGVPGSGDTTLGTVTIGSGSALGSGHAWVIWTLMWDSTSETVDGFYSGAYDGTAIARTAVTQLTSVASAKELNFLPSFTFSSTGTTQNITVMEFSMEQV